MQVHIFGPLDSGRNSAHQSYFRRRAPLPSPIPLWHLLHPCLPASPKAACSCILFRYPKRLLSCLWKTSCKDDTPKAQEPGISMQHLRAPHVPASRLRCTISQASVRFTQQGLLPVQEWTEGPNLGERERVLLLFLSWAQQKNLIRHIIQISKGFQLSDSGDERESCE